MPNLPTLEVETLWIDKSGGTTTLSFFIERPSPLNLTVVTNKVKNVVQTIDSLSNAKFVQALIKVPIQAQITSPKENPDSGSRHKRAAKAEFIGGYGENLQPEKVVTSIPDPKSNKVVVVQGKTILKTDDTNVAGFIQAMLQKALTTGGENLSAYDGSFIRQRV